MHIEIPYVLLNKTEKEIKEIISEVGLVNFSKFLTNYLENPKHIDELKNNPDLLEKVAFTLDSVLMYYQMTKTSTQKTKELPLNKDLINEFVSLYSTHSKENYDCR